MAETVGFEPTVPVKVQLISSQSRYDHFDTSPYMLTRIREVNALFNFIRILIRTQRVLKLLVCGKPAWLKALLSFDFSKQRNISSLCVNCLLALLQSRTVPKKSRLHKGFSDEMTLKGIVRDGSNIISIFPYPSKIRQIGGMFGGMLNYFL